MSAFVEPSSPHVMNTYGRLPIALSHGQGCRVWDVNGREYAGAIAYRVGACGVYAFGPVGAGVGERSAITVVEVDAT